MFLEERIAVLERQMALLEDEIRRLRANVACSSTATPVLPRPIPDSPTLTTKEAARLLNRAPQTLRVWATYENGPIRPQRLNRRLLWATEDVIKLIKYGDQMASTGSLIAAPAHVATRTPSGNS